MGDWHQTCALTHLPILENDRVAVLPIIANEEHSGLGEGDGYSSPFSLYSVFSPVFFGYSNERGGISRSDDINFEKHYLETLNKSGKLKDLKTDDESEPHSYSEFIYQVSYGTYADLSFLCFHEDAFLQVINNVGLRRVSCHNEEIFYQNWIRGNLSYLRVQEDESLLTENNLYMLISEMRDLHERDAFLDFVKDLIFNYQVEQTILLCRAFSLARFLLIPSMGSGHQSEEYSILKDLSEFVQKKCDSRMKDGRNLKQAIFVS